MKFQPFSYITPSIEDMKKLLFPFKLRYWLKLGFVSLLSANVGRFNPGSNLNIRLPSTTVEKPAAEAANETAAEITGNVTKSVKETLGSFSYLILPLILILLVISLIVKYITSTFTFIFLEALVTRKVEIKKAWRQNNPLGFSFFLFRIVFGLIILALIALFLLPMIIPLLQQGFTAYFENFSLASFLWMIPMFILLMLLLIAAGIFMSLVYHFSVVHMYFKRLPIMQSIKDTFKCINKRKLEVFIFLIARLVINIITGIIAALLFLVVMIPILIIGGLLALPLYLLVSALGWNVPVIALIVIIGLAFLIGIAYVFTVILLPVSTFSRYFSINNYKALMKK